MSEDTTRLVLIVAAAALFGLALHVLVQWRVKKILARWITESGLKLAKSRLSIFPWAPDSSTSYRGQVVLHFTAKKPDGSEARGWARCGGPKDVFFSKHIEVHFL